MRKSKKSDGVREKAEKIKKAKTMRRSRLFKKKMAIIPKEAVDAPEHLNLAALSEGMPGLTPPALKHWRRPLRSAWRAKSIKQSFGFRVPG